MSRPKFCPKCGNPIADEGKFCGKCGNPIVDTEEALAQATAPAAGPQDQTVPSPAPIPEQQPAGIPVPPQDPGFVPGSTAAPVPGGATPAQAMGKNLGVAIAKHKVPIIIGCAAIVVIIAAIIILLQITKYQKIDAQKLFAFKFKGLQGSGTVVGYLNCSEADPYAYDYEYDEDGNVIEKEYSDYFSYNSKDLEKVYDKASNKEEANQMRSALLQKSKGEYDLKVKFSKESELSNGDKITCTVEYDEEELSDAKIKLENTEFEIEAKGLVEGEEIDMFAGFEPKFSGMDERGEIEYERKSGTYPFISYYLSDGSSYNLKNGDKLTFQASFSAYDVSRYDYIDSNDSSKGIYFKYEGKTYVMKETTATKEYTVSGLTEATSVDVFDKIKFDTKGGVPYVKINRVNTDDMDKNITDNVSYYLDLGDKSSFKSGDTFKVKAYISSSLLSNGYKPSETPDEDGYVYKEFTVDDTNWGRYITNKSEQSELDAFKDVFAEFTKKFENDYTNRSYLGGVSLNGKIKSMDSFDVARDYIFLNNGFEDGSIGAYDNKTILFRIYKIEMTITDSETEKDVKKAVYACFKFSGPHINAAGEAQLESNYVSITVADKIADLVKATVDKEEGGKAYQLGKPAEDKEDKKDDDSSKKADESSKKDDDSSSKKSDESSKKDDESSSKKDDESSSKKDDESSSKKDDKSDSSSESEKD